MKPYVENLEAPDPDGFWEAVDLSHRAVREVSISDPSLLVDEIIAMLRGDRVRRPRPWMSWSAKMIVIELERRLRLAVDGDALEAAIKAVVAAGSVRINRQGYYELDRGDDDAVAKRILDAIESRRPPYGGAWSCSNMLAALTSRAYGGNGEPLGRLPIELAFEGLIRDGVLTEVAGRPGWYDRAS